ncbi:MAG: cytochrome c [Crocinitomicaceae bacterium]|nr:cytochrome c [Crocinitomicaceae bacterium]MBK8927016.1 cytochrome c [Crocinitomicaceae bacterium]
MSLKTRRTIFFTLFIGYIGYSIFVYTIGTETNAPINEFAREGKRVFQEKNCIACHQFYGLGGYMGPDLTNVISNKGEAYVRSFIANGTQKMPKFNLSIQEIDYLVAYLTYIDSTSKYPHKDASVTWYGMVNKNLEK